MRNFAQVVVNFSERRNDALHSFTLGPAPGLSLLCFNPELLLVFGNLFTFLLITHKPMMQNCAWACVWTELGRSRNGSSSLAPSYFPDYNCEWVGLDRISAASPSPTSPCFPFCHSAWLVEFIIATQTWKVIAMPEAPSAGKQAVQFGLGPHADYCSWWTV